MTDRIDKFTADIIATLDEIGDDPDVRVMQWYFDADDPTDAVIDVRINLRDFATRLHAMGYRMIDKEET